VIAPGSSGIPSPLNYSELGSPLARGSPTSGIESLHKKYIFLALIDTYV